MTKTYCCSVPLHFSSTVGRVTLSSNPFSRTRPVKSLKCVGVVCDSDDNSSLVNFMLFCSLNESHPIASINPAFIGSAPYTGTGTNTDLKYIDLSRPINSRIYLEDNENIFSDISFVLKYVDINGVPRERCIDGNGLPTTFGGDLQIYLALEYTLE